jgi:predicted amidophosphoribosyltransferase
MEQIRCRACRSFRDGNRDERECTGCGRALRVKNGYCRLCWIQLSGGRAWEGTAPPAVAALPRPA